ncbi:helix-turn-helix transcriptional regulator [Mesorhizobium sp.]|uniref:helix-turn-helix domain-containing protein n=1 Tax=Mesorhizobium sp. TaxID=1871066 RepID=UPI000FE5FC8A|nr:helix-turn-helix transcriptional regulator [Mesorhizobium sp.]RWQ58817.1 MAG: XRE family transcriptional regulator [Mesorhizobium sp.]
MRTSLYSPLNARLSEAMKRARLAAGMTQAELADATGRTQAYISKFENGQLRLDVADFLAFARCLDIDAHHLLDELATDTATKKPPVLDAGGHS